MRSILTAFFLLFMIHSCFAAKSGSSLSVSVSPAYTQKQINSSPSFSKKQTAQRSFLKKLMEDREWINSDTAPNRYLEPSRFNPVLPDIIGHTDESGIDHVQQTVSTFYAVDPALNYQFIYRLLYPKHSFW